MWDAQTGRELFACGGHAVLSVDYSPNGKHLAGAGFDKQLVIWDAETGKELQSLQRLDRMNEDSASVAYSPDGKLLAATGQFFKQGSPYSTIRIWDTQTGKDLVDLRGHNGDVYSVAFSPDSKRLVTGGSDRVVKIWDVETGQELSAIKGHTDIVFSAAFSADGARIVSGSYDGKVKIWDAKVEQEALTMTNVGSRRFSPDGKRFVYRTSAKDAGEGVEFRICDAKTMEELVVIKDNTPGAPRYGGLTFSPDSKRIKFEIFRNRTDEARNIYDDVRFKICDAQTGKEQYTIQSCPIWIGSGTFKFSPDGKRFVCKSPDRKTKMWDAATGKELFALEGGMPVFSPEGKRMVTSDDTAIKILDAETGNELLAIAGYTRNGVQFSNDGKRLASLLAGGTIKVWDSQSGQMIAAIKPAAPFQVNGWPVFSPDGKHLAVACVPASRHFGSQGGPMEIKVWDIDTGKELFALTGFPSPRVESLFYGDDGKRLVTASGGLMLSEVRLSDAESGHELLSFKFKDGSNRCLASFSPDGHQLSVHTGNVVKLYDATPLPERP